VMRWHEAGLERRRGVHLDTAPKLSEASSHAECARPGRTNVGPGVALELLDRVSTMELAAAEDGAEDSRTPGAVSGACCPNGGAQLVPGRSMCKPARFLDFSRLILSATRPFSSLFDLGNTPSGCVRATQKTRLRSPSASGAVSS